MSVSNIEHQLLHQAAGGCVESLKKMAIHCTATAFGGEVSPLEALGAAEAFARLATFKDDLEAIVMLGSIMLSKSKLVEAPLRERYRLEGFQLLDLAASTNVAAGVEGAAGILSAMAEEGDDEAATVLDALVGSLTAESAARLRETVKGQQTYRDIMLAEFEGSVQ